MRAKYFINAFLAVGLISPAATHAVGLGVGVFGGWAVPTGDMAAEGRFDLRPSTALGVRGFLDVYKSVGVEFAAAYNFNYPARTKEYQWAEVTELLPINVGGYYEVDVGSFRFSPGGGLGYYFLKTKLASAVRGYGSGFGNVRYPVELSINAPGIYAGAGVSYLLGRFALGVTPRYNYIFNSGEYEGEEIYGDSRTIIKDWDDSYVEVSAGIIYGLF